MSRPAFGLTAGAAVAVLVAACGGGGGAPTSGPSPTPSTVLSPAEVTGTGCTLPPRQNCYSVQALRNAYGTSPLLARGIDGRGRTVDRIGAGAPLARYDQP